MINCNNCGQQNDDAARWCVKCGTSFSAPDAGGGAPYAPGTADPYAPQQQQQQQQQQGYPDAGGWPSATPPSYGSNQGFMQPQVGSAPGGGLFAVGEKREPIMVIVLGMVTCGIYAIWWFYTYAMEIKNALGREDLNPATDLILTLVTCGIYGIYAFYYKYPKLLMDMQQRVGLPVNDISTLTLILAFVFGPISIFMIQTELNKIWDAAGAR